MLFRSSITNSTRKIQNIPTNIYYQNPRLIINLIDYSTKPFRILYTFTNLLGTSIKTGYEIIKKKYNKNIKKY